MLQIGVGQSTERNPVQAAKKAIEQARLNLRNENINLAIAFGSIDISCPELLKTISLSLGGVQVIGSSGAAIISNQGIFKHGLVVMLLGLPKEAGFITAAIRQINQKTALTAGEELGKELLLSSRALRRNLILILSDGLIKEGSNLIYGLQERFGSSFPLVGGSASDNLSFQKTYLYFNQEILSDAACGILWTGQLNFGFGIKHGWKPLGKPRVVTKSKASIVEEIDNAPAVKIYEEYLAKEISELKRDLKHISILYPIGIYLAGEEEYLLRNLLSIEDNGALVLQGNVPEGSQIRLMIGTKDSCLNATHQAVEQAKQSLANSVLYIKKRQTNNFVLVFNSVSRYNLLKRQADKELEIIKDGLGRDTPIIGLYTYGEQAPLRALNYQGRAYFHNQTITILTISA